MLALAAFVYGLYGFDGPLYRDYGIYLYGGQRFAEGVPPYAGIFDHKGPLPQALAGLGILLFAPVGLGDVYAARLAFFLAGCLSAVAVYLLGEGVFRSRATGLFAALTFLGFYGYARPVASGPEPKTPMILFEALSLLFMSTRRWFWAGMCGSLAFLAWQPMGALPIVALILALAQPGRERVGAALRVLSGAAAPLVAVFAYYLHKDALGELLDGLVLFNLLHVSRRAFPILNPSGPLEEMIAGYGIMLVPCAIGLAAIARLYFVGPPRCRHAPLLLSLPVFAAFSALDFQVPEDLYPFLPYAAAGFGGALAAALGRLGSGRLAAAAFLAGLLLLLAISNTPLMNERGSPGPSLGEQRESVERIEERLGEEARIVSINAPQVLALLGEENPNPYLFTTDGLDRQIEAEFPGGFEGWILSIEEHDPGAIAFFADAQRQMPDSGMFPEHREVLIRWLRSGYHAEKIGNFWLYVEEEPRRLSTMSTSSFSKTGS